MKAIPLKLNFFLRAFNKMAAERRLQAAALAPTPVLPRKRGVPAPGSLTAAFILLHALNLNPRPQTEIKSMYQIELGAVAGSRGRFVSGSKKQLSRATS